MGTSRCWTCATSTDNGAGAVAPLVWLEQPVAAKAAAKESSAELKIQNLGVRMSCAEPPPLQYPVYAYGEAKWCVAIRAERRRRAGRPQPNPLAAALRE